MNAPKLNATPAAQAAFNAIYNKIAKANPGASSQAITSAALKYLGSQGYRAIGGRIVTPREAAAYAQQVQAQQRAQPQHRPPAKKRPAFASGTPIYALGKRIL